VRTRRQGDCVRCSGHLDLRCQGNGFEIPRRKSRGFSLISQLVRSNNSSVEFAGPRHDSVVAGSVGLRAYQGRSLPCLLAARWQCSQRDSPRPDNGSCFCPGIVPVPVGINGREPRLAPATGRSDEACTAATRAKSSQNRRAHWSSRLQVIGPNYYCIFQKSRWQSKRSGEKPL
jgi:hypothetical protein